MSYFLGRFPAPPTPSPYEVNGTCGLATAAGPEAASASAVAVAPATATERSRSLILKLPRAYAGEPCDGLLRVVWRERSIFPVRDDSTAGSNRIAPRVVQLSSRWPTRAEPSREPELGERDDRRPIPVADSSLARSRDAVTYARAGEKTPLSSLCLGKVPSAGVCQDARNRSVGRHGRDGAGRHRRARLVAGAAACRREREKSERGCTFHATQHTDDTTPPRWMSHASLASHDQ